MNEALLQGYLERGVKALERLAEDPIIEVKTGPPVCPNCEKMNPTVRVQESEATGSLGDFLIQAHCLHCNSVFYALPQLWDCVSTVQEAERVVAERAEIRGNDSGQN